MESTSPSREEREKREEKWESEKVATHHLRRSVWVRWRAPAVAAVVAPTGPPPPPLSQWRLAWEEPLLPPNRSFLLSFRVVVEHRPRAALGVLLLLPPPWKVPVRAFETPV